MRYTGLCGLVVAAIMLLGTQEGKAVDKWGLKSGAVELKSSGPLAFGPDGILFVGDPTAATVVAIATDDTKSGPSKASINIQGFQEKLAALLEELKAYPAGISQTRPAPDRYGGFVVPLQLQTPAGMLSFFSTTTVLGTPVDVTLSELAIESFFPADDATAAAMRAVAS